MGVGVHIWDVGAVGFGAVDVTAVGVGDGVGTTGATERVTLVTGATVVVVGVGVGVAGRVTVCVGVGVGQSTGTVGVAEAVAVGVGVGVTVDVGVAVGHTGMDSLGNGSVALGEFSLGFGRAEVGDPVSGELGSAGSGLGFADELGRPVGSGTGLIGW